MLEALDELMSERQLDALLVYGDSTFGNPDLYYVVGTILVRGGIYLKRRKKTPILIVSNIDHGPALKGLVKDVRTYSQYNYEKLIAQFGRDRAGPMLFDRILNNHKVTGRIGLHGRNDANNVLNLSNHLRRRGHRIVSEKPPSTMESAREIKSPFEIDKIKNIGLKTQNVIRRIVEFLTDCEQVEDHLVHKKKKLNVRTVKTLARRLLAEENLVCQEDMTIAVGPKSADPHYAGEDEDLVMVNQPIVVDMFPQEVGGYWYDMTRTFVVGRASQEVRRMYESVNEAQRIAFRQMRGGCRAESLMNAVCDHFSNDGFKTIRDLGEGDKQAEKMGFIHSLGHGVGLTIGERPYLSLRSDDVLKVGNVFTVEPGLYDPIVGGVRIEDVIALTEKGMVNLTGFEKILEVKV